MEFSHNYFFPLKLETFFFASKSYKRDERIFPGEKKAKKGLFWYKVSNSELVIYRFIDSFVSPSNTRPGIDKIRSMNQREVETREKII